MANTTLYNPASLNKEDLISSFVVRTKTFEKIYKDIKDSDMHYPEKHYIIQGQRGMGKTTLLLRLKYEVEKDTKLNKWLIPVFFNEETYDVNSLAGLWEKLLKYLDEYFETKGEYYDYTEQFVDAVDYEKKCFEYFIGILRKSNKKLILFFDNFGELFLDNLRDKEKRRLREILMDCNDIRIIGASAVVINDLHDYSQPFYEFFYIIRLEGLTKEETFELIGKLQENCEGGRKIDLKRSKAKIDTLSILTGGVIRTVMMLYQVLLDDKDGSALEDLEQVLDKATPLYKHRIEDLPLQQRKIVDVIAKKWDAVSAKEIANEIREDGKNIATKLVSAQLNQLEKNNIIEKKETNTKNHLYQLRERFFNIWYLMRNGDRRDKRRVAWLTKFLELWYADRDELSNFILNHVRLLKSGSYKPNAALMIIDALANTGNIELDKMEILYDETKAILNEDLQKQLPSITQLRVKKIHELISTKKFELAIDYANRIEDNDLLKIKHLLLIYSYIKDKEDFRITNLINTISLNTKLKRDDLLSLIPFYGIVGRFHEVIDIAKNYSDEEQKEIYEFLAAAYFKLGDEENVKKYVLLGLRNGRKVAHNLIINSHLDEEKILSAFQEGISVDNEMKYLLLDYLFEKRLNNKTIEIGKDVLNAIDNRIIKKSFKLSFYELIYKSSINEKGNLMLNTELETLQKIYKLYDGEMIIGMKYLQVFLLRFYLTNTVFYLKDIERLVDDIDKLEFIPQIAIIAHAFVVARKFTQAENLINNLIKKSSKHTDELSPVFLELLAKKQNYILLNILNNHTQLKDIYKPIYYALMTLLKDKFPNEILKMGEELKEPVKEILNRVKEMAKEYK